MRYLGLALFAEGPTDHWLLAPILRRVVEDLCVSYAQEQVLIGEVLELWSPADSKSADRATQILQAAREAVGAFHVLFIHADGGGDPDAAVVQRAMPAIGRIAEETSLRGTLGVAVVPVRETEAWALVDGDALRAGLGTLLDDVALGVPNRPRDVEELVDPKQVLNQALAMIVRSPRRRRTLRASFFPRIGEQVRLQLLMDVPAYMHFREELHRALLTLRYVV